MRYAAVKGSESSHCCFTATVIDTSTTESDERLVCECYEMADAERIAALLNLHALFANRKDETNENR